MGERWPGRIGVVVQPKSQGSCREARGCLFPSPPPPPSAHRERGAAGQLFFQALHGWKKKGREGGPCPQRSVSTTPRAEHGRSSSPTYLAHLTERKTEAAEIRAGQSRPPTAKPKLEEERKGARPGACLSPLRPCPRRRKSQSKHRPRLQLLRRHDRLPPPLPFLVTTTRGGTAQPRCLRSLGAPPPPRCGS